MTLSGLNWWLVVLESLIVFLGGWIWFGPKTFYKPWIEALNKKEGMNQMYKPGALFSLTYLQGLIQIIALGWIINSLQHHIAGIGVVDGAVIGFWLGIGIVAMPAFRHSMFAEHRRKAWVIEASYDVLNLVIVGALFGLFN